MKDAVVFYRRREATKVTDRVAGDDVLVGERPTGLLPGEWKCIECGETFVIGIKWMLFDDIKEIVIICDNCGTTQLAEIPPLRHAIMTSPTNHMAK